MPHDYKTKHAIESAQKSVNSLIKIIEEKQTKIDELALGVTKQALEKIESNFTNYCLSCKTISDIKEWANKYNQEFEKAKAIHERNIPKIENNKAVYNNAITFMKNLGLCEEEAYTKRMGGKTYWKTAEWKLSIIKMIPVTDSFEQKESNYKRAIENLNNQEHKLIRIEQQKAVESKKKLEEQEKQKQLIKIAIKIEEKFGQELTQYKIDDLLEILRDNDKYLDLAVAMELTRCNWSEGFYRVRSALDRFKIETEEEKTIISDISECMYCDDGRVFRDCEYNYSVLYDKVNPEIMAIAKELFELNVLEKYY